MLNLAVKHDGSVKRCFYPIVCGSAVFLEHKTVLFKSPRTPAITVVWTCSDDDDVGYGTNCDNHMCIECRTPAEGALLYESVVAFMMRMDGGKLDVTLV